MPGSPPSNVVDPGVNPPPSTRSSSPMPVARRGASAMGTSAIGCGVPSRGPGAGRDGATTSDSVPQASQSGQRPSHRGCSAPHSAQRWTTRVFALVFVVMATRVPWGCDTYARIGYVGLVTSYLLPSPAIESLDAYFATETGGLGLARAVELGPDGTLDEITRSGLRGRGGAGFPTGRKWSSIVRGGLGRRFVVCNAAEGEPATFKDRALMRANPYQLLEGVLIAALTVGADAVYIALKASFELELGLVATAAAEMQAAGICGDC